MLDSSVRIDGPHAAPRAGRCALNPRPIQGRARRPASGSDITASSVPTMVRPRQSAYVAEAIVPRRHSATSHSASRSTTTASRSVAATP